MKTLIWAGMFIGSAIGGFVPMLWGADLLSFSAVLFSGIGAIVGILVGYKIGKLLGVS